MQVNLAEQLGPPAPTPAWFPALHGTGVSAQNKQRVPCPRTEMRALIPLPSHTHAMPGRALLLGLGACDMLPLPTLMLHLGTHCCQGWDLAPPQSHAVSGHAQLSGLGTNTKKGGTAVPATTSVQAVGDHALLHLRPGASGPLLLWLPRDPCQHQNSPQQGLRKGPLPDWYHYPLSRSGHTVGTPQPPVCTTQA